MNEALGGPNASADASQFGTFRVEQPRPLPETLDLFIAGGGPAGVAAAMRAAELGLTTLIVDYDDLMKRIRDYAKDKLIKPSYGGGDSLPFPPGGPLVTALHFDDTDKDDMVARWKQHCRDHSIAAKVGSEFTGLDAADNGEWSVKTWNHRATKEVIYRARTVLIAIGAGVPRRFDIPGNPEGIAFRLDAATRYVGAPALVIGGGTSAAEAVIAISNAKVQAKDPSALYWSYRGDKLPKVSKALSEAFFDAYVGNGNVRYLALSEPVAVVTGPDQREYLSVRVDRKVIAGCPVETVHLEFPKEFVVACIGEDVPLKFIQGLGTKVPLVNKRPLMLVNMDGELSLGGVFLVGDARGPRYVRCSNFEDPRTYQEVVQKRNIKAAMWEAVRAVEVVAARLGRGTAIPASPSPLQVQSETPPRIVAPLPSVAEIQQPAVIAQLVSLLPDDTQEEVYPITKDKFTIGRQDADANCAQDAFMGDQRAVVTREKQRYTLQELGNGGGVWIRIRGVDGHIAQEGDLIWAGSQVLRVTTKDGALAVEHYNNQGAYQQTYLVNDRGIFVGRSPEATLTCADMSLSRRHAQVRAIARRLTVVDLRSKNGTFIKINDSHELTHGDEFRVGSKRFRLDVLAPVSNIPSDEIVVPAPIVAPPAEASAAAPAAGQCDVRLEHPRYPVVFKTNPDQDLLHGYFNYLKQRDPSCKLTREGEPDDDYAGKPLGWDCKSGYCGLCVVQVLDGAQNFSPVDPGSPELKTLEGRCGVDPDPQKYRLACLARVKGPVRLTVPEG